MLDRKKSALSDLNHSEITLTCLDPRHTSLAIVMLGTQFDSQYLVLVEMLEYSQATPKLTTVEICFSLY